MQGVVPVSYAKRERKNRASTVLPDLSELNLSRFEGDPAVTYAVDSRLRLQYCNAAWDAFAIANGGDSLLRPSPIGCDLLAVVPWDLKEFYTNAFETVWRMGVPWEHQYECSSPEVFRQFHMRVAPLLPRRTDSPLVVVNSLQVEYLHPQCGCLPELEEYRDAHDIVTMCCHCRRTKRPAALEVWDWVPEFVRRHPAKVSHGLCAPCFQLHYTRDKNAPASPSSPR